MPLSAAEKKRRSRARKPSAYLAAEREASRKRMAMNRARNRAQKRAGEIKSILSEEDREAFEARADEEKKRLICDWFHRNGMRFEPKVTEDDKILHAFITKRELCEIDLRVAEFEISMFRVGAGREFDNASGLKKDDEKTTAKSHKIDSSEQNLNNQIDRLSEKEMARGNMVVEILDEEQEHTTKPAYPGKNSIGVLSELEQNFNNEMDRLSKKEMVNGNEVIEILDKEQEDITKPAFSGTNGIGVSSEEEEDCISWEDEIAAAKAMAIMQLRREHKPAKDFIAPGAKAALQGAPQARTVKEKGKIPTKNASVNAKIKARILHKVALAAGPSVADAMRGAITQAGTNKSKIPGTQIRPRAGDKRERSAMATEDSPTSGGFFLGDFLRSVPGSPATPASHGTAGSKSSLPTRYSDGASRGFFLGDFLRSVPGSPATTASHGAAGSKSSFPTRYSDGAPIIAGTAAAQREAIATTTAADLVFVSE